jgi:DNA mismatch repair protein Mlh1 C-terminus
MAHTHLLSDSFGVDISACGHLCALPDLLCGTLPNVQRMPTFLAQLSKYVTWQDAQRRAAIAEVCRDVL